MPRPKKKLKLSERPFYKRRWGVSEKRNRTRLVHHLEKLRIERPSYWWRERKLLHKLGLIVMTILVLWIGSMYGIAQWYIISNRNTPTQLGTTFVPRYARYFGLDPKETLHALIYDVGFRHMRLVSYWDDHEHSPGNYNFDELDWQFKMAEETNTKVSLAIGLRQPRWPECHMPRWAAELPMDEWRLHLKAYMGQVIDRYKHSPALQSYQLENEFFLTAFGECPDFSRERLVDEYNFVKQRDPNHTVIISRSNNALGLPIGEPQPDLFAVSVYKRVWDKTITHRYYEYPFPGWFYGFLAGAGKIVTGKDMIVHELQAEPWAPEGYDLRQMSIEEQNKSMDANRLRHRIKYGRATGMKTIDLWGAEWWYARKVHHNDSSLWKVAQEAVQEVQNDNAYD